MLELNTKDYYKSKHKTHGKNNRKKYSDTRNMTVTYINIENNISNK